MDIYLTILALLSILLSSCIAAPEFRRTQPKRELFMRDSENWLTNDSFDNKQSTTNSSTSCYVCSFKLVKGRKTGDADCLLPHKRFLIASPTSTTEGYRWVCAVMEMSPYPDVYILSRFFKLVSNNVGSGPQHLNNDIIKSSIKRNK